MAGGPWLAWLPVELLGRLSGGLVRPLPVDIGRYRYRTGFVARRAAEDLAPFRALEQAVRDIALGRDASPAGMRQGQPLRSWYKIALTASRKSVLRGRPNALAAGRWGQSRAHSASVKSLV